MTGKDLERAIIKAICEQLYHEHDKQAHEYRFYLDDVHSGDWDALFIRVPDNSTDAQVYLCDADDMNGHFEYIRNFNDYGCIIGILDQLLKERDAKKEKMDYVKIKEKSLNLDCIKFMFNLGYNIPKNFAIPAIKDHLAVALDSFKPNELTIGETGLYINEDGDICISVFFSDREEPCQSYNYPLKKLSMSDIVAIGQAMRYN